MVVHVDEAVIAGLKDFMGDQYPSLLETYLNDSAERLLTLRQALTDDDMLLLRQTAHSFKGSCGNIGAPALAQLCQQVEAAAREHQTHTLEQLLQQIEQEFVQVKLQLITEIANFKA